MNHSGSDTYFSVHLVHLAVRKQYATIYLTFLIFPRQKDGIYIYIFYTSNQLEFYYLTCKTTMAAKLFVSAVHKLNTLRPRQNGYHFPDAVF